MNPEQAANDDGADGENYDRLQEAVIAYIADHDDPQEVLEWGRHSLPQAFPGIFGSPDPARNARAGYWLVRECWNAMPLASNSFLPKPLPEPALDEPCPCGTGHAYAACCLALQGSNAPTTEDVWPSLVRCRSDAYWLKAERAGRLPALGLTFVAARYHTSGRWRALRRLAEARLAVPRRCTDPDIGDVIDWLCDA